MGARQSKKLGLLKIIDVRTPEEFAAGHLAQAVNIDVLNPDFPQAIAQLDKSVPYLLYCRSGQRSGGAAQYMESIGFADVKNLGSLMEAAQAVGVDVVVEN